MPLLAVLNPAFPGWRHDLERAGRMGVWGVRLFPNYHAYRLREPAALALFDELRRLSRPVVLSLRLWDERCHHPTNLVPAVPLDDVKYVLERYPELPVVIAGGTYQEARDLAPLLVARPAAGFEISYLKTPMSAVEALVELLGAERVLYGSGAPLNYPESAYLRVTMADLPAAARASILGGNAQRLFQLAPLPAAEGATAR
jgi:predicted TIM-barrel fold metal-dependent hydrolase